MFCFAYLPNKTTVLL